MFKLSYNVTEKFTSWNFKYGCKCFIVGGAVRDTILNLPFNDIDACLLFQDVNRIRDFEYNEHVEINPYFKIISKDMDNNLSLSIAKKEMYNLDKEFLLYTPTSLFWNDVVRRDFTINTIYWDVLDHVLCDPLDAMSDIKTKNITPVYSDTFLVDPSRIIRLYRYIEKLNFKLNESFNHLLQEGIAYWSKMILDRKLDYYFRRRLGVEILHSVSFPKTSFQISSWMKKLGWEGNLQTILNDESFKKFFCIGKKK